MKLLRLVVVAGVVAGIFGCDFLRSKEKLFSENDVVKDKGLTGEWVSGFVTGGQQENVLVKLDEKTGEFQIKGKVKEKGEAGPFGNETVVVFKVGRHFLAQHLAGPRLDHDPMIFQKISMIDGVIYGWQPNMAAAAYLAEKEKVKVDAAKGEHMDFHHVNLLDTTENCRAFLGRHMDAAFWLPMEMYKRPEEVKVKSDILGSKEQESFEVLCLLRSDLTALAEGGQLELVRADDWKMAKEENPLRLMRKLDLPAEMCDEKVAALYKDVRKAMLALKESGWKAALPAESRAVVLTAEWKKQMEKQMGEWETYRADPLGHLAAKLPEGHRQKKELEQLSKRMREVVGEWERKGE